MKPARLAVGTPITVLDLGPMRHPDFEIEIITQGWVGETPEQVKNDLCSHGSVRLAIGGCIVAPGAGERDYTISTSALALLRTLESDTRRSGRSPIVSCCVAGCF
jgi:hypothetical protein